MPSDESSALARGTREYWRQSRRPLSSLLFVLPLLAVYEAGVLWLGPDAARNGAEVWLQQLLGLLGFGGCLLVPFLTIFLLLAWHHTTHENWRVSGIVLYTMAAESVLLAMILVGIAQLQAGIMSLCGLPQPPAAQCVWGAERVVRWFTTELVRFFGAGIYEELLFRLILLPIAIVGLSFVVPARKFQVFGAVVLTSLAFSTAHYIGPRGEPLVAYTFIFRFLAGAFFATLFVYRGFGIAAGTHALYDIFVGFPLP